MGDSFKSSVRECVLTVSPKVTSMLLPFTTNTVRTLGEFFLTLQVSTQAGYTKYIAYSTDIQYTYSTQYSHAVLYTTQ